MPEESPDHGQMTIIELQAIDPSPFKRRQHFEEDKLKGLASCLALGKQPAGYIPRQ
jgi:hypothetical protein